MASPLAKFITGVGTSTRGYSPFGQVGQSPDYTSGSSYAGPSGSVQEQADNWNPYAQSLSNKIGSWMQEQQAEQLLKAQQGQNALNGGSTGNATSIGGDWAGVDQWTALINQAAQATGVDPNIIKSIMKLESDGNPEAGGAQYVSGLMQVNSDPDVWGSGPWQNDNYQNILKGAQIYKGYLDQYGGDQYTALRAYHGWGSDGNTSDQEYADIVMGNYNQLRNNSSVLGNGTTPPVSGTSSGAWQAITGGQTYPISQEMGLTDFAQGQLNGQYSYATAYGVQGHAGIDVATPLDTTLYAPVGGTVKIAGGNPYYTDERYGSTPNTGELMIQLDNGDQLILGHMESIGVQVGQRINAGQAVGQSGFGGAASNGGGPHVHVEYRKLGGNTSSGYTAVDPRTVLGGGAVNLSGGSTSGGSTTGGQSNWWGDFMSHFTN